MIVSSARIDPKHQPDDSIANIDIMQCGEGPIPQMNITMINGEVAYVRPDKPEYADQHKNTTYKLNSKQKRELQARMDKIWKNHAIVSKISDDMKISSVHEAAVDIWIDTYGGEDFFEFTEDGYPDRVDYTQLP